MAAISKYVHHGMYHLTLRTRDKKKFKDHWHGNDRIVSAHPNGVCHVTYDQNRDVFVIADGPAVDLTISVYEVENYFDVVAEPEIIKPVDEKSEPAPEFELTMVFRELTITKDNWKQIIRTIEGKFK